MKNMYIFLFLILMFPLYAAISEEADNPGKPGNDDQIIHIQEIYKTVDTFELKVDIFYTDQSLKKKNNTAIVFFHGGGWAYGSPGEFFTTCERYAKMGIVTFSVQYRLSIENGVTPHRTISPIECVMDAKSAIRWVRENAGKFNIDRNKIVASGQSAGGHLALCTAMIDEYNEKSDPSTCSGGAGETIIERLKRTQLH